MDYFEYLRTPHWQRVRADALKRHGHRCAVCDSKGPLEVHHRTYVRKGHELPNDVIALCNPCHDNFHNQNLLWRTAGPSPALVALVKKQMAGAA